MKNERVIRKQVDQEFISKFFLAIERGELARVKELFNERVIRKQVDQEFVSKFFLAIERGELARVKELFNEYVIREQVDQEFISEFFLAIKRGELARVNELFMDPYNIHPDQYNSEVYKKSALYTLAEVKNMTAEHFKIAELLFQYDANPNIEFYNETTPLHAAALQGNIKFVNLLLKKGADATHLDQKYRVPFYYAAINGYYGLAKLLCEQMRQQDPKNFKFLIELSLTTAASDRSTNVLEFLLISKLIDVNHQINQKMFIQSINQFTHNEVDELDENDEEEMNMDGNTALHLIFTKTHKYTAQEMLAVIECLKKHGADVNIKNAQGETAYQLAEKFSAAEEMAAIKEALKPTDLNKQLEKISEAELDKIWNSSQSKNKDSDNYSKEKAERRVKILAGHLTASISNDSKQKKYVTETSQQPLQKDVPDNLKEKYKQSIEQGGNLLYKTVVNREAFARQSVKQLKEIQIRQGHLEKQIGPGRRR